MQIIKDLRSKNGMNQTDLATAIGVSLRTIQLYEKKDANIPIKNLTKIAEFFGISIAELYLHEVNEEEGIYTKKKVFSASRNIYYSLANGKYLVMAPVLMADMHRKYLEGLSSENPNESLVKSGFVLDYFDDAAYMAFEIVGNSMYDGSIDSIPNGSLVLGRMIETNELISNFDGDDFPITALVIFNRSRIICKRVTRYNEKSQTITCTSLNDSPEYKDFDMPLSEITKVYKVVKKQI